MEGSSSENALPDYELREELDVSDPAELRALAHPTRAMILDLLLERAATVSDLASALAQPRSSVAHHVNVLAEVGLLQVVRTRRVKAIDERYYGRTARLFRIGLSHQPDRSSPPVGFNPLAEAAAEASSALEQDKLASTIRRVRIPEEHALEFWEEVVELAQRFVKLPRSGETIYAFVAGLYPTDHPTLPSVDDA